MVVDGVVVSVLVRCVCKHVHTEPTNLLACFSALDQAAEAALCGGALGTSVAACVSRVVGAASRAFRSRF